jgi:hypothetical protein
MTVFVSNTDDAIVSPPCFVFISVHGRSSAVETQYEGTGRFTPVARLIGWLFASCGLKSGHGDPSLFHWLRLGPRTSFWVEPKYRPRTLVYVQTGRGKPRGPARQARQDRQAGPTEIRDYTPQ